MKFIAVRYNLNKKHYVMFLHSLGDIVNYCHGDLFENGQHIKGFLWHSRFDDIRKQFFERCKAKDIKLESAYEYKGKLDYYIHRDTFKDLNLLQLHNQ